jgi:cob(I)alamin adenosyltransferase
MAVFQRISRVTTKSGDRGMTARGAGERVRKDHPAICVLGELDELNCAIGLARAVDLPERVDARLAEIQNDLFIVGADVLTSADRSAPRVTPEMVAKLEKWIEGWNRGLPPLKEFVLPGGTEGGARLHLARAMCRRSERALAGLLAVETRSPCVLPYLNRLSDALFVMARYTNLKGKSKEESARFSDREERAKRRTSRRDKGV